MKRSKSTSSHLLSKLGLLAAVSTVAVGGVLPTVSWAQQQAEPSATASEGRVSRWGTQPIASETVLQGTQAGADESASGSLASPYRAATTQPAGTSGGANQGATLGPSLIPPQPLVLQPPVAQPPVNSTAETETKEPVKSVDISSRYQPVAIDKPATSASDETAAANVPNDTPADHVAVTQDEQEKTSSADKQVASESTETAAEPSQQRSLIQAMLADGLCTEAAEHDLDVNGANRVKHCFNILGIVTEKACTDGACTAGTCDQKLEVAAVPATNAPEAVIAKTAEASVYPMTAEPALMQGPPTVQDAAVSQVSHVVPAQWREAEPRAIQVVQGPANPFADDPAAPGQLSAGHFEVIEEENKALEVRVRRSLLLRTPFDIYRTAVVDSAVCDVVQFTPREVSIIGKSTGSTNVTFWFEDGNHRPVTYVVRVIPDLEEKSQAEVQYRLLEEVISELFPDSKVRLLLVADKLIVKGQAANAEDAANILAIIRGQSSANIANNRNFASPVQGFASPVLSQEETGRANQPRIQVVNMLQVPGIQQVALRVKIAQLNRSAARGFGVEADARINFGGSGDEEDALFIQSMLNMAAGNAPSVITQFDDANINLGLRYLQQQGVIRLLSEPTLVTLSGRPATFVSGGEFAVPTIVGGAGVNAVTTDFRAFGVIVSFLPTVLDKDRIRLQVAPEFSQINSALTSSNGTFGLNTNAVTTTVEMREGQTLAIAGLLEDTMKNSKAGNVPGLEWLFGTRDTARNENELIILVTPELVHPMEPEEVPPLPGFDVTEPTNKEFYLHGHLEGHPTSGYRSTVWPELRRRYRAGGPSMTSGQFGHGQ